METCLKAVQEDVGQLAHSLGQLIKARGHLQTVGDRSREHLPRESRLGRFLKELDVLGRNDELLEDKGEETVRVVHHPAPGGRL